MLNTKMKAVAKSDKIVKTSKLLRIALKTLVSIGMLTKKSKIWIVYHSTP